MINQEGQIVALSQVSLSSQYGFTQSATEKDTGWKFLRMTDIKKPYIDWDTVPFCEIDEKNVAKYKLETNDIVVARTGDGSTGFNAIITEVPNAVFASYLVRFKINDQLADPYFVASVLSSKLFSDYIDSAAVGSGQKNINAKQIGEFKFHLPPKPIQRKIAEIVRALNEKIKINLQMNETLEQMAMAIYKHWFVDFGPFQNEEFVDSESGDIPQFWKVQMIGDFAEVKGGKRLPKGKSVLSEKTDYPYIRVKDFNQNGVDFRSVQYIDEESHQSIKRYIITADDIYISIAGTVGLVGIIPSILSGANLTENAARITGITKEYRNYLLLYLRTSGQDEIMSRIVGSTQPKLPLYNIKGIRVVVPDNDTLNNFNAIIDPLLKQIEVNQMEILELGEIRDYLLPRLLSGEIEVKAAEEKVEEVLTGA